jgi:predicted nuclease with TOPRIM domain
MTMLSYIRVKFTESSFSESLTEACHSFTPANRPSSSATELAQRIHELENEKRKLEELVCELLHKNQQLRRNMWREPHTGSMS